MSDASAILGLPYLQPAQAQKHVTHNEALQRLDLLVQMSLAGLGAETPPAEPAEGEAWGLGPVPTGAWAAGTEGQIAVFEGSAWTFLDPLPGWRAWDRGAGAFRLWDGSAWIRPEAAAPQVLAKLGLNTSADGTNRLAVASDAALFTHDGAGHQVKINKAAVPDTAALLYQTGFSGRAEIGLSGSDDLSVKVSEDGAAWTEALRAEAATGRLTCPTRLGIGAEPGGARLSVTQGSATPSLPYLDCAADGGGDLAFRLAGDGNGSCDGAWTGGGADYAEWFEWADGNPDAEDRRGLSVTLEGARIRPAEPGEDPVGVVSAAPAIVGDGDIGRWKDKYLRDPYGSPLLDETGARVPNPAWDPDRPYTPRAERPEWVMVGLLGKLRIRPGQPTGPRWIRMRETPQGLEEWLVR